MKDLLVIDLESTCHPRGQEPPGFFSEIIEIGAVLLDARELRPIFEHGAFVKPVLFPELSPFCKELTTITQADVDGGTPLAGALDALRAKVAGRAFTFASWGFYDRRQIARCCKRFAIPYPFEREHLSLKHEYARFVGRPPTGMDGALRELGLPLLGTHHRGLDDAKNIAAIAVEMIRGGWTPKWLTEADFAK